MFAKTVRLFSEFNARDFAFQWCGTMFLWWRVTCGGPAPRPMCTWPCTGTAGTRGSGSCTPPVRPSSSRARYSNPQSSLPGRDKLNKQLSIKKAECSGIKFPSWIFGNLVSGKPSFKNYLYYLYCISRNFSEYIILALSARLLSSLKLCIANNVSSLNMMKFIIQVSKIAKIMSC